MNHADLGFEFDANTVDPSPSRPVIPAGWYPVQITSSEIKAAKSNPNHGMVALEVTVIDGTSKGVKLTDNLNLWNSNRTAVDIAQKTLSQISHATGQMKFRSFAVFQGIPMMARVSVRPPREQYGESNQIEEYKKYDPSLAQSTAPGGFGAAGGPPAGFGAQAPAFQAPTTFNGPPQGFNPPPVEQAPQFAPPQFAPPAGGFQPAATPTGEPNPPPGPPAEGESTIAPPWGAAPR